ncbi:MAG: DUF2341 domain-containing protein [Chitinispirillaceae bacterium]|jgi:hypothetical protein
MNRVSHAAAATAVLCLVLWRCSIDPLYSGGSGTDVETKVLGSAVDSYGKPVAGAIVHLRPSGYVFPILNRAPDGAGECIDTVTDASGNFCLNAVDAGSYIIEINNQHGFAVAVRFTTPRAGATANLGADTLVRTSVVFGTIPPELRAGEQWFVQIYGLERIATADYASGAYSFSDIPAGRYSLRLLTSAPGVEPIIVDSLTVPPGDTVTAPTYPEWKHSCTLILNTSPSGANVSGDVVNFPVLVRLTSNNFDFTGAEADGRDLRFTKANGAPLPYEIEQWDAANRQAAVWVNVDTVHGNNGAQHVVMLWGNPNAAAQSNPAAVFDTAQGFVGVWHLGQPAGGIVPDATANGISGTAAATATVNGAVGMAQSFNGTSSLIQAAGPNSGMLNFPENGNYSLSAWVNANALDSLYHGIVYKSNFEYGLQMRPKNEWEFFTYIDQTGWDVSRFPASAGSWHALTGVRSGTHQYLYVDGNCVDSSMATNTVQTSRVTDAPLQIGHCPDGGLDPDRYFSGVIDEVRISRVAISADWIKLCFMNQKDQDALVKW